MANQRWAVAVHGGAGDISRNIDVAQYEDGLLKALAAAEGQIHLRADQPHVLIDTKCSVALNAAVAAVVELENHALFNAGRGSVMTSDGTFELEASVMEGKTRRSGAVAGLSTFKNPIEAACLVLHRTSHQVLGFNGAARFLDDQRDVSLARADSTYFSTPKRLRQLESTRARGTRPTLDHSGTAFTPKPASDGSTGTVGAVVCDLDGNVACATSTGGMTCKLPGRIGDTPIPGAGFYADNATCAVSGTGFGDEFLRFNACGWIAAAMDCGRSLSAAAKEMVHRRFEAGSGGVIAVNPQAEIVMELNCTGMFRASSAWNSERRASIWT